MNSINADNEFSRKLNWLRGTRTQYQTDSYLGLIAELLIAIYSIQGGGLTPLAPDAATTRTCTA